MAERQKRTIIPGIVLLCIGCFLLLRRLDLLYFRFSELLPLALLAISGLAFISLFVRKNKGASFPATVLLILGLFFLLRNYRLLDFDYYFHDFETIGPIFLLAFGFGFVVNYLFDSENAGLMIPGIILLFLGGTFLSLSFDVLRWRDLSDYWPILLIVAGIALILRSRQAEKPPGQLDARSGD